MIRLSLVTTIHNEFLPLLDERGQPLRRRDGRRLVVFIKVRRERDLARLYSAGRGFLLGFVDGESPATFQFNRTRLAGNRRLQNDRFDAERERISRLPIDADDAKSAVPLIVKLLVPGLLGRADAAVLYHLAERLVRRTDGEALVWERRVEHHNGQFELSRLELVDAVHQTGQECVGTRRVDGVIACAQCCGCMLLQGRICAMLQQVEGSTVLQHQWKQQYRSSHGLRLW